MSDLSEAGAGGDPIAIVPYDPRWPDLFDTEAVRLSLALGETAVRIEHIGSTAVRGLAAKPVIDIQISVPALEPATPFASPRIRATCGARVGKRHRMDHGALSSLRRRQSGRWATARR